MAEKLTGKNVAIKTFMSSKGIFQHTRSSMLSPARVRSFLGCDPSQHAVTPTVPDSRAVPHRSPYCSFSSIYKHLRAVPPKTCPAPGTRTGTRSGSSPRSVPAAELARNHSAPTTTSQAIRHSTLPKPWLPVVHLASGPAQEPFDCYSCSTKPEFTKR